MKKLASNTKYWYFCKKKVMGKNTSVSLGDHFESFLRDKIGSGRYQSASEVIRAGLRLLEEEERKIGALKEALETGEDSGIIRNFHPRQHLKDLHGKHQQE